MELVYEIDIGFGFYCLYQYDCPAFVIRQLGSAWFIFEISNSDLVALCYSAENIGTLPKMDSLNLIYCSEDKNDVIQFAFGAA